jgi:hypothetical protein
MKNIGCAGGRYENSGAGCVCEKKKEFLHFYFLTDHGKITQVLKQMQRV